MARVYSRGKRKCSAVAFPFSLPALLVGGGNSRRITVERVSSRGRGIAFRVPRKPRWIHFARHACRAFAPVRHSTRWKKIGVPIAVNETVDSPPRSPTRGKHRGATTHNAFSNNEQKRRQIDRSSTPRFKKLPLTRGDSSLPISNAKTIHSTPVYLSSLCPRISSRN